MITSSDAFTVSELSPLHRASLLFSLPRLNHPFFISGYTSTSGVLIFWGRSLTPYACDFLSIQRQPLRVSERCAKGLYADPE